MARSPTDTIKFLTFDELGRLFAATRTSARDRALFLIAYRHALTPLIWEHVNPYGRYELNMRTRIAALA